MIKSVVLAAIVCSFVVVIAHPIAEESDVQEGMKSAFQRGLDRFGGAVRANDNVVPVPSVASTKVFSHYTKNLRALGGGKPKLREQYRNHNYVPLAPSVEPREFKLSDPATAKEAADVYRPHSPLQFTNDILR